jgi:hypothetical protein
MPTIGRYNGVSIGRYDNEVATLKYELPIGLGLVNRMSY